MTTSSIKASIQCDIEKVWETVSAVDRYSTWRSDVSKAEIIDENHFTVYTRDGYSTRLTVIGTEPPRRWELDMENSHIKGHWTIVLAPRGSETEIDFTACVTAKKLSLRPVGKSVFEKNYSKKEQAQFVTDLKKALNPPAGHP